MGSGGDIKSGQRLADVVVEETYLNSYVAHAPIETHTALAKVEGDKATVWASTQIPFRLKDQIAQVLGFPSQNVRIITPFVGITNSGRIAFWDYGVYFAGSRGSRQFYDVPHHCTATFGEEQG